MTTIKNAAMIICACVFGKYGYTYKHDYKPRWGIGKIRTCTYSASVDNAKWFSKVVLPSCIHTSNTQELSWSVRWY